MYTSLGGSAGYLYWAYDCNLILSHTYFDALRHNFPEIVVSCSSRETTNEPRGVRDSAVDLVRRC